MPDERDEEVDEIERELERRMKELRLDEGEVASPDSDEEPDELELKLRDLDARLDAAKDQRREKEGLFDREFEQRLEKLHDKADQAKAVNDSVKREQERNWAAERSSARGLGIGLTVAYTIVGLPLVGAGVGWLIDRSLGTSGAVAIGVVAGAALGMVMALMMLNRQNQ
jgi:F0F1-type ATP synthase assembly protein I